MRYSRLGIDYKRKGKQRVSYAKSKQKKVDWVNIALFILLFLVVILFIVGKW